MTKSKISPSHLTRIEAADLLYQALHSLPEITKFAMGPIRPAGGGQPRLKVSDGTGCIEVQVRGQTAVQTVRIYSKNIPKTKNDIFHFAYCRGWPWKDGR